jgi:bacterioferritin
MKGEAKIIELLNAAVKEELTAICQYILHSEMQNNWGYTILGGYIKKQAIDEMKHLDTLVERILFLDGTPRLDVLPAPKVGANVKEQLANDLEGELKAVKMYNEAAAACAALGDNSTRALFEQLVKDEEQHTDWLEAQLGMIQEMGYDNYLARQLKAE